MDSTFYLNMKRKKDEVGAKDDNEPNETGNKDSAEEISVLDLATEKAIGSKNRKCTTKTAFFDSQ